MMISFNTRKSLSNIYVVCKKLVRGELFSIEDKDYLVIFNKFIINNYHRINKIIDKLIHVKVPEKLIKLTNQFYEGDNFYLEDVKRNDSSINYEYFKENKNDFMQHKSICFTTEQLFLLYNIVNNNKERFIQDESFYKIFENLSNYMPTIKSKPYEYCVIISDKYNSVVNELLFLKKPKIILGESKSQKILTNIKYCINYLISNLEIFPNWIWVTQDLDTLNTFKYINSYLDLYYKNKNIKKESKGCVPLNWYSLYIINNLKNLEQKYKDNDFLLLYEIIESEIFNEIKQSRKMNNFFTINMTTKNFLIDNKIKKFEQELDNVKSTELNIKTAQFIESAKINVCLTNYVELNTMAKYMNNPLDIKYQTNPYMLIISKENDCIHQQKMEKKNYKKIKDTLIQKNIHCSNINEFTIHLSDYYKEIGQDILNSSKTYNDTPCDPCSGEEKISLKGKNKTLQVSKKTMVKEILDQYKKYVSETMNESNLFNLQESEENNNSYNKTESDIIIDYETKQIQLERKEKNKKELLKKYEDEKNKSLMIIYNYILKRLSIKIYEAEEKEEDSNDDKEFNRTCIKLSWISHTDLDIPDEVFNKNLFNKVIEHVKRMDYLRTPHGMLYEFGLGVQIINSMFIFMLNQKQAEAGDLLPLIIYSIIAAKPKKIIFNLKFIKFFMDQNQLLGNIGYNLIQCESSIGYIQSLNEKQLKMEKQFFEDKCKYSLEEYEVMQKKTI